MSSYFIFSISERKKNSGDTWGLLFIYLLQIWSISSMSIMHGWFYFAVWNNFLIFYYASFEVKIKLFIEYALKLHLFLRYAKMQWARYVLPEPIGPANKNPLLGGAPNLTIAYLFYIGKKILFFISVTI